MREYEGERAVRYEGIRKGGGVIRRWKRAMPSMRSVAGLSDSSKEMEPPRIISRAA